MTNDEHLVNPHHDVLQQEFADLYVEISNALNGEVPTAIGEKIDGIANGVIAYEEELLAALRRKDENKSEQANPPVIEVAELEVDGMLHRISMCLVDIINLCEPPEDKREEFDSLSFSILGEIEDLKALFNEKDEGP